MHGNLLVNPSFLEHTSQVGPRRLRQDRLAVRLGKDRLPSVPILQPAPKHRTEGPWVFRCVSEGSRVPIAYATRPRPVLPQKSLPVAKRV